jgi:hypothetical protein
VAIGNCTTHDKPKTYQCYVCHKPLCDECPSRDGCCSERCQESRLKFGGRPTKAYRPGQGPIPIIMTLLKVGAFAAVVYYGARYLDLIPAGFPGGPQPTPAASSDDEGD